MTGQGDAVGLIGIGLVGTALARRLLGAGFAVPGYDLREEARARLRDLGGRPCRSIADVVARCERLIIAVFDTDQVETVVDGPGGILSTMPAGASRLALCASTCDPDRIAALARRVAPRGLSILETPLSGASDQIARGEAVCLVGGDPALREAAQDILAAICRRDYFTGPAGNGGKTKLAINLILGLNRAALAEGLVFAERLGLAPEDFLEVARDSAAYSQVMDVKGAKMVRGDFTPLGKVAQSLKDFSLILEFAARAAQTLPLATVYADLMRGCIAHGEGDCDNAAIIRQIRRMGGSAARAPADPLVTRR